MHPLRWWLVLLMLLLWRYHLPRIRAAELPISHSIVNSVNAVGLSNNNNDGSEMDIKGNLIAGGLKRKSMTVSNDMTNIGIVEMPLENGNNGNPNGNNISNTTHSVTAVPVATLDGQGSASTNTQITAATRELLNHITTHRDYSKNINVLNNKNNFTTANINSNSNKLLNGLVSGKNAMAIGPISGIGRPGHLPTLNVDGSHGRQPTSFIHPPGGAFDLGNPSTVGSSHHPHSYQHQHNYNRQALTSLVDLGLILPNGHRLGGVKGHLDSSNVQNLRFHGGGGAGIGGGMGYVSGTSLELLGNGNNILKTGVGYYEPDHYISEHTVMAIFTSQGEIGGPCRYMPVTRQQSHQCRKEVGLPDTLREAQRLATNHCEEQFRYDRWNCSIEIRGKRNIFKKLYRETAFVHALTAAALTHSIARACADGRMTKCSCGTRKKNRPDHSFQWGGCNDNLKHGKRMTRTFLELRDGTNDEVTEILRHDSEVGIEAVSSLMKDKCKCHGVSGSCSMKTCWKKMSDFNTTATLLRQKYNQAIRKAPSSRTFRRDVPMRRLKRPRQRRKKQSQYTTLYYMESSPTYCSVTKDRQCLHPENCGALCCGRGYVTRSFKQIEKCRCRFNNGRCCQLICDYCQRYEDRYFCK